jgi:hypothetical protein
VSKFSQGLNDQKGGIKQVFDHAPVLFLEGKSSSLTEIWNEAQILNLVLSLLQVREKSFSGSSSDFLIS